MTYPKFSKQRIVWQIVRRIINEILGVEGLLGYYVALEIEKLSGYHTEFFFLSRTDM